MAKTFLKNGLILSLQDALAKGAKRTSPTLVEWDVGGRCQSPVTITRIARPDTFRNKYQVRTKGSAHVMEMVMDVPCKHCVNCLRARAAEWRQRAVTEFNLSRRTWFGTLTFKPEVQFMNLTRCRSDMDGQGIDFDNLDENEKFALMHKQYVDEIQRYLKRARERSGASLRFLSVAEAHKSGMPHYHMLVHEVPHRVSGEYTPIRHAILKGQWRVGFSDWKLVEDPRAAAYVCKYLAKSNLARVRASVRYGKLELNS